MHDQDYRCCIKKNFMEESMISYLVHNVQIFNLLMHMSEILLDGAVASTFQTQTSPPWSIFITERNFLTNYKHFEGAHQFTRFFLQLSGNIHLHIGQIHVTTSRPFGKLHAFHPHRNIQVCRHKSLCHYTLILWYERCPCGKVVGSHM